MHVHQIEETSDHELLQPGGDVHGQSEVGDAPVQSHGEAEAHGHHGNTLGRVQQGIAWGREEKLVGWAAGAIVLQKPDHLAARALKERLDARSILVVVRGGDDDRVVALLLQFTGKIANMVVDRGGTLHENGVTRAMCRPGSIAKMNGARAAYAARAPAHRLLVTRRAARWR